MIPKVIHRIAIGPVPEDSAYFWDRIRELHPGWELKTWADPFDPAEFPRTAPLWSRCSCPAQQADIMRLEILEREGGIYLDWDMEIYRPLDAFLPLDGFAAFDAMTSNPEENTWVGTGVLGFRPHHPAIEENLKLSLYRMRNHSSLLKIGPFATDEVMRNRSDVLLLPRASFYGWDRRDRDSIKNGALARHPWAYGLHRMHGSWETKPLPVVRVDQNGRSRWMRKETKL